VLPHLNSDDPTRVLVVEWSGCRSGTAPLLYRVEGGGHRVPSLQGGPEPPDPTFGLRNRDIESAEEIWAFFKRFRL
jgi:polyhydroxybutyrate depolymerase